MLNFPWSAWILHFGLIELTSRISYTCKVWMLIRRQSCYCIYIYIVCTSASACPVPSLIVLHATYIKNKCPLQLGSRSSWLCCSNYNILGLLQTLLEICSLLWLLKCFFVTTPCQTRLETHPLLHVEGECVEVIIYCLVMLFPWQPMSLQQSRSDYKWEWPS